MKNKIISVVITFFLLSLFLSSQFKTEHIPSNLFLTKKSEANPQVVKKPKDDYMNRFLDRTKPTGLKENPALQRFLNQSHIKWVIRTEKRHILN